MTTDMYDEIATIARAKAQAMTLIAEWMEAEDFSKNKGKNPCDT